MYSPPRLAVLLGVSIIVLSLFGGSLVDGKKKSKKKESTPSGDSEGKGVCALITCTSAPENLACTRTHIKNPSLLERLGTLKDCCPAWRCKDNDGSYSTYFGISGDSTPDSFTGEAEQYKDGKGEMNDKCVEAKAVCPKPDGTDKCVESNTLEANDFKPKGDLDSCCPTYNCTKSDGSYHVHFAMTGGTMPTLTDTDAVAKQKGEPNAEKKCPNMICAPKPSSPDDGPVCESSTSDDSSRIKILGPFRECCDVWKCSYDDGSYYVHFELQAPGFWVADTSFYSELPEVPDEGVTIVQDYSDEDEPEPTTAMTTTTAATPASDQDESDESDEITTTSEAPRAFKPKRHKKKKKQGGTQQVSSQVVTVILNSNGGGNSTAVQSDWAASYDAAAAAIKGAEASSPPAMNPTVQSSLPNVPNERITSSQSEFHSETNQPQQFQIQYQSSYQSSQQDQPQPLQIGPDPNAAQMQSLQAMNMQQMQAMNMQSMQNMQNMNNNQMQMMMGQQNLPMG